MGVQTAMRVVVRDGHEPVTSAWPTVASQQSIGQTMPWGRVATRRDIEKAGRSAACVTP